jgi:hypothetical protein
MSIHSSFPFLAAPLSLLAPRGRGADMPRRLGMERNGNIPFSIFFFRRKKYERMNTLRDIFSIFEVVFPFLDRMERNHSWTE